MPRMVLGPVTRTPQMLWFGRNKERQRFYLLPGMGGRARRQKEMRILRWAIAVGLLFSALMACALYFLSLKR